MTKEEKWFELACQITATYFPNDNIRTTWIFNTDQLIAFANLVLKNNNDDPSSS